MQIMIDEQENLILSFFDDPYMKDYALKNFKGE